MNTISYKKKRLSVMLLVALLFFAGHYCVYAASIAMAREICLVSSSALLGLCLFGVCFLLTDCRAIRSCRIFALQMGLMCLVVGFSVTYLLLHTDLAAAPSQFLTPGTLISGNVYAFIMLMYPVEVLCLERMTFRRYFKLFIPVLLTALFYYGYIRLAGYQMTDVDNWQSLWSNFHKFDVWFRLILIAYPIWMFVVVLRHKKRYVSRHGKNDAVESPADLGWIDYYIFGCFLILISYMIAVPMHSSQSMLMHSIGLLVFFVYSFYHIMQQKTPAMTKLFAASDAVAGTEVSSRHCLQPADCERAASTDDKYRFVDKIPEYKAMLEHWMQTEKPYLNKDFKLLDVMQVLPLNRSYLSRIFNEAYGETFFDFIMRYRLEESIQMLDTRHDLTITHIAQICGFSSASVFGRAFLKNVGMTPKEYRNR